MNFSVAETVVIESVNLGMISDIYTSFQKVTCPFNLHTSKTKIYARPLCFIFMKCCVAVEIGDVYSILAVIKFKYSP